MVSQQTPAGEVGEVGVWLLYAVPLLAYVARPRRRPAASRVTEPSPAA